ncbi:MAG TPA: Holliday junction resolvase RuvX [Firmicutes bacterium]|nr:Holliday junction resolvase RuvX [Bacillota bacterium]
MAIAYAALMLGQDNEGDKNLRIIAIDPGSRKCGIAIAEQQGTLFRQVVATDEMEKAVKRLIATYRPLLIVVGDRTYGRRIAQLFEETLPVVFVDEHGSSEEARQRYWKYNKRTGWRRLLPTSLQVPPEPYDDIVAEILAERFFLLQ